MAGMRIRFATLVSPTAAVRPGVVTGSPEHRAYLFVAAPLGVDVLPTGRFHAEVGLAPELDLSFRDGFSWRIGSFVSVQFLREPHRAR